MRTSTGRADHRHTWAVPWRGGTVVALVVGSVLLVWAVVHAIATEPVPWDKPAQVDGAVVHLSYLGSECRDGASVDVEEGAARVVVTISETVYSRSCGDVGVPYEHEVRLDAPLGGRELVDGACLLAELATQRVPLTFASERARASWSGCRGRCRAREVGDPHGQGSGPGLGAQ